MFCAFEGPALILRVYGQAVAYHPGDEKFTELEAIFPPLAGSRQIFDVTVDLVQTSCGTGVPVFELKHERGPDELLPFFASMSDDEQRAYWAKKNTQSLDGKDTGIFE